MCAALAGEGGRLIRDIHASGQLRTRFKSKDDPCTVADLTVQKLYYQGLRRYLPTMTLRGEESEAECKDMRFDETRVFRRLEESVARIERWGWAGHPSWRRELDLSRARAWIDPVDGTKEFTLREVQAVTSLIGVAIDGLALYGVVGKPFSDVDPHRAATFFGGAGLGVAEIGDDDSLRLLPRSEEHTSPAQELSILTCKHHGGAQTDRVVQFLRGSFPDFKFKEQRTGGSGNGVLQIACGNGDAYLFPALGLKPWDTCAGEALIVGVGGKVADCYGDRVRYEGEKYRIKGLVCARRGELVDGMLAKIRHCVSKGITF